jgi:hypothetical protein
MNKIIAKFAFVATVACLVAFGGSLSARADYGSCMQACANPMWPCVQTCEQNGNPSAWTGYCIDACEATLANCQANCH